MPVNPFLRPNLPERARLAHVLWHELAREIGDFHAFHPPRRRNPDTTSRGSMAKALVLGVTDEMDFRSLPDAINQFCGVRDRSTSSGSMNLAWWLNDREARVIFNGRPVSRRDDGLTEVDFGVDVRQFVELLRSRQSLSGD